MQKTINFKLERYRQYQFDHYAKTHIYIYIYSFGPNITLTFLWLISLFVPIKKNHWVLNIEQNSIVLCRYLRYECLLRDRGTHMCTALPHVNKSIPSKRKSNKKSSCTYCRKLRYNGPRKEGTRASTFLLLLLLQQLLLMLLLIQLLLAISTPTTIPTPSSNAFRTPIPTTLLRLQQFL